MNKKFPRISKVAQELESKKRTDIDVTENLEKLLIGFATTAKEMAFESRADHEELNQGRNLSKDLSHHLEKIQREIYNVLKLKPTIAGIAHNRQRNDDLRIIQKLNYKDYTYAYSASVDLHLKLFETLQSSLKEIKEFQKITKIRDVNISRYDTITFKFIQIMATYWAGIFLKKAPAGTNGPFVRLCYAAWRDLDMPTLRDKKGKPYAFEDDELAAFGEICKESVGRMRSMTQGGKTA